VKLKDNGRPVFDENLKEKSAKKGCLKICCDASIPANNNFVVGLARKIDGQKRPVAVVPCVPGTEYEFAPREMIYIERHSSSNKAPDRGTVVSALRVFGLRKSVELNFHGDITVSETPRGFLVDGRPGDIACTAADGPAFGEEPGLEQPSTSAVPSGTSRPVLPRRQPGQNRSQAHSVPPTRELRREAQASTETRPSPPNAVPEERTSTGQGPRAFPPAASTSPSALRPQPTQQQPPQESHHTHTAPAGGFLRPEEQTSSRGPQPIPNEESTGTDDSPSFGEDLFSADRLRNWHTVFIVNDTGSMQFPAIGDYTAVQHLPPSAVGPSRWERVREALGRIAEVAMQYDETGIDVHFLIHANLRKYGIKNSQAILNLLGRIDIKRSYGPTKFEPILRPILDNHLARYEESIKTDLDAPRPLDIIVLTDGKAHDKPKTEKLITSTAKKLERFRAPLRQIGIQFVQVGQDSDAATFLKHFDDDLKKDGTRDVSPMPQAPKATKRTREGDADLVFSASLDN